MAAGIGPGRSLFNVVPEDPVYFFPVPGNQVLIIRIDVEGVFADILHQFSPFLFFHQDLGINSPEIVLLLGQALNDVRVDTGPFFRGICVFQFLIVPEASTLKQLYSSSPC